jgi:hypothetical protein
MKIWTFVALCAALGGCVTSGQETVAQLGQEYVGQNVDALVGQWGEPDSTIKVDRADTSYVWKLGNQTELAADRGSYARFCKVSVVASSKGIVTQINTEDLTSRSDIIGALGGWGSVCATRLGNKHRS